MTREQLASLLDGRDFIYGVDNEVQADAFYSDLIIGYGLNEDTLCLYGAGYYEGEVVDGVTYQLIPQQKGDAGGAITLKPAPPVPAGAAISVEWHPEDIPCLSWRLSMNIPYSPFTLYDGEEPYCVGVVFSASDL